MIHALFNHLWQSTLFVGVIAMLAWFLREHGAHLRYWLWYAGSLKFLLPFSLLIALGGHFSWHSPATDAAAPVLGRVVAPFHADTDSLIRPSIATPVVKEVAISAAKPDEWAAAKPHEWAVPILVWLWILGGATVAVGWMMRWSQISRAVRCSIPLSIDAPIPVRVSSCLIEPGVVGILRPFLLVPQGIAERLDAAQLRTVLLHEFEHVRRRDNLFAAIHMVIAVLFWFYPLVWWLGRQLVAERERACDEAVIAAGCDPETYAQGILNVCRLYLHIPLPCTAGVAGADLKKRVESIMTRPPRRDLSVVSGASVLAIAGAAVLLPVALGAVSARAIAQDEVPVASGSADVAADTSSPDKISIELSRALLVQERYAELDERINGFQAAYEAGTLDDLALLHAIGSFVAVDPALERNFDAWIAAYPNSYAARLSRGIYYFKSGVQTRGKRYISHTTTEQIRGMQAYFAKAQSDLHDSLALNSKPVLSYNYLIRISMNGGNQERTRALLDQALKFDRVALAARRPYLKSLEARWGGSLNEMLAFMQESREAGLSADQLSELQALVDAEREWLKKHPDGSQQPAVDSD